MNINLSETIIDLIINILNIVILFIIVKALVYKPVHNFLENRTAKVNEEVNKAQKILDEANEAVKSKDTIIEQSRINAEKEAEQMFEEAKKNADSIIAEAKKTAKALEEKADAEIKAKKENLIASSKDEIAELSVQIAERILERETNAKDNERILNDFFGSEGEK